jgi:hypothetical protein
MLENQFSKQKLQPKFVVLVVILNRKNIYGEFHYAKKQTQKAYKYGFFIDEDCRVRWLFTLFN